MSRHDLGESERRERERRWRQHCRIAWRRKWLSPLFIIFWPPYCLLPVMVLLILFVSWLERLSK